MAKTRQKTGLSLEKPARKGKTITRRDFLKGGAAAAAFAAITLAGCTSKSTPTLTPSRTPTSVPPPTTSTTTSPTPTFSPSPTPFPTPTSTATAAAPDTFLFLNIDEAATVKAVCGRIIPGTASDPGAVEAKAYIYIDRALNGYLANKSVAKGVPLPTMQTAYQFGLAAMDAYSQSKYNNIFAKLTTTQQDAVLTDMQSGKTGSAFTVPSDQQFFGLLLTHVREGTFCDPDYGGNQNLVGWKIIGYPGSQPAYTDANETIGADQSKITPLFTLTDLERLPQGLPSGASAGF